GSASGRGASLARPGGAGPSARQAAGLTPPAAARRIAAPALRRPASLPRAHGIAVRPRRARSARALRQPVVDGLRHLGLGAAGDVDADMAAAERQLGVVAAADQALERLR